MPERNPLVVCPNAALELTHFVTDLDADLVTATRSFVEAGGKAVNVARLLCKLGLKPTLVTCLSGYIGSLLAQKLADESVFTHVIDSSVETRCSIVLVEERTARTRIVRSDGREPIKSEVEQALLRSVARLIEGREFMVISGSLANGFAPDLYAKLIQTGRNASAKVLMDCHGDWFACGVRQRPFLVQMNLREAELTLASDLSTETAQVWALHALKDMGAANVVITRGENGAIGLLADVLYDAMPRQPYCVTNPIGAGDAFLAGMLFSLVQKKSWIGALETAAATAQASVLSPCSGRMLESWRSHRRRVRCRLMTGVEGQYVESIT